MKQNELKKDIELELEVEELEEKIAPLMLVHGGGGVANSVSVPGL